MATQQQKWERIEEKMIDKYLPKLKKLLKNDTLILNKVPIEINKRKNMKWRSGLWDGEKITLYKHHFSGLTKETLVHELLHAFIFQNNLYHLNKKSQLFNKLVLNLNTKKFNIGSCHGAYLWKYECKCGYWLKTNNRSSFGRYCGECGSLMEHPKRNMTKNITI